MGTLFAGIIRAPMTSVFMIFEITQDYQILVPLMVANMLSFVISRHYQPVPVYHALLRQDGIHLPSPAAQIMTTARTARDVMRTEFRVLSPEWSLERAWQWAVEHQAPAYLVGSREQLIGAISHRRLEELSESEQSREALSAIVVDGFVHAHPDHPIDVVLDRLAESGGVLPVVSRQDARRVEGVITPESVLRLNAGPRP
jgi:chloride channel protein, CIC family